MKKITKKNFSLEKHLGCFGDFNISDPLCKNFCALRILCAIEQDHNSQLEMLEDLLYPENILMRAQ